MWQKSQISSIKPEFVMIFVNCLKTFSNISWNFLTKIPWNFSEIFLKFLKSISWNVSKTFACKIWAGAVVSNFVTDCFNPHANLCSKCPCLHWINILNAPWVRISSSTCWYFKKKGRLKSCFHGIVELSERLSWIQNFICQNLNQKSIWRGWQRPRRWRWLHQ